MSKPRKRKRVTGAYLTPMPEVTTRKVHGPFGFTGRAKRTDGGVDVCPNMGNADDIARLREHADRESEKRSRDLPD